MKNAIAVSCGDVNGIGLECFVKAAAQFPDVSFLLAVNPVVYANYLGERQSPSNIKVISLLQQAEVNFGVVAKDSGAHALASLETTIQQVVASQADALLTLPVSKEACTLAGWNYPGQTEMLGARLLGKPMMMLCSDSTRVALATVHMPLSQVVSKLSPEHIADRIVKLAQSLHTDFGIAEPRVAVLSIDPHAGESGTIGTDDINIVAPGIEQALQTMQTGALSNATVSGPHPADGFFGFGSYKLYDGILAMYHDQGLIPLKLLSKGGGVNFTAGLSKVRTSPDHGTAFNIAGEWIADQSSTAHAIELALDISRSRARMS